MESWSAGRIGTVKTRNLHATLHKVWLFHFSIHVSISKLVQDEWHESICFQVRVARFRQVQHAQGTRQLSALNRYAVIGHEWRLRQCDGDSCSLHQSRGCNPRMIYTSVPSPFANRSAHSNIWNYVVIKSRWKGHALVIRGQMLGTFGFWFRPDYPLPWSCRCDRCGQSNSEGAACQKTKGSSFADTRAFPRLKIRHQNIQRHEIFISILFYSFRALLCQVFQEVAHYEHETKSFALSDLLLRSTHITINIFTISWSRTKEGLERNPRTLLSTLRVGNTLCISARVSRILKFWKDVAKYYKKRECFARNSL